MLVSVNIKDQKCKTSILELKNVRIFKYSTMEIQKNLKYKNRIKNQNKFRNMKNVQLVIHS